MVPTALATLVVATAQSGAAAAAVRAVSLFDLIIAEYDDAVSEGGQVLSPAELADQQNIARSAASEVRALDRPDLVPHADELAARVAAAGSPQVVVWRARRLQDEIAAAFQVSLAPPRPPDFRRAAALYRGACAACHGLDGHPPRDVVARFAAPPTAFANPREVRTMSPQQIYSAVTVGVPEKPMPAYAETLDASERWDLAFYALTFAHPERRGGERSLARARRKGMFTDIIHLARQTDDYLRMELRAASLSAPETEAALGAARNGPFVATADPAAIPPLLLPARIVRAHVLRDDVTLDAKGRLLVQARIVLDERPLPARRGRVDELLRVVREQLVWRTGRPPFAMDFAVFGSDADARASATGIAGCVLESEDDVDCENRIPAPFSQQLAHAFAGTERKARIVADERKGSARVRVALQAAGALAAVRAFFDDAFHLYQQAPELKRLVYQAAQGKTTLLQVALQSRGQFDALGFPVLQARIDRAPAQEREGLAAALYGEALSSLPRAAVRLSPAVRRALSAPRFR